MEDGYGAWIGSDRMRVGWLSLVRFGSGRGEYGQIISFSFVISYAYIIYM